MKRKLAWALATTGTSGALVIAFIAGRAWAGGVPTTKALSYSGLLQDANGAPLSGEHNIQVNVWDAATDGTMPACQATAANTDLSSTNGRFSIPLPDTCATAVGAHSELWAEVLIDGASLGRSKLGAVPYALEANHAVKADSATNATNATHATNADTATSATSATNASHATNADNAVSATSATNADHATNADTATTASNAANADHATNADHANVAEDATGAYVLGGRNTNAGGVIYTRAVNHVVSFDYDGTLHFYVDATNVKNFIIPHPTDPNRYLVHTTLEGPENAVFYRGTSQLHDGLAEVSLPSYFEAATRAAGRTVLLTPKFASVEEPLSSLAASEVVHGVFVVRAIDGKNPEQSFDWEVKAVRSDVPDLLVEPNRDDIVVHGDGPYKYFSMRR